MAQRNGWDRGTGQGARLAKVAEERRADRDMHFPRPGTKEWLERCAEAEAKQAFDPVLGPHTKVMPAPVSAFKVFEGTELGGNMGAAGYDDSKRHGAEGPMGCGGDLGTHGSYQFETAEQPEPGFPGMVEMLAAKMQPDPRSPGLRSLEDLLQEIRDEEAEYADLFYHAAGLLDGYARSLDRPGAATSTPLSHRVVFGGGPRGGKSHVNWVLDQMARKMDEVTQPTPDKAWVDEAPEINIHIHLHIER